MTNLMNDASLAQAVHAMVERQLRGRGIRDERVLEAMATVPRHVFVPEASRREAYADRALPTSSGQTISQPYIVALMTELLDVGPGDRVLDVGTGSGYQAAVLAAMGVEVFGIERIESLAETARQTIAEAGLDERVDISVGDGLEGRPNEAPFDGIVVAAAAPSVPPTLLEQLAEGGRMVIPLGDRVDQSLYVFVKENGKVRHFKHCACRFVPLIGEGSFEN